MDPRELLRTKRAHLDRLANRRGAAGEAQATSAMKNWTPRPKGSALRNVLAALTSEGISIRASSFDAIASRGPVDFRDLDCITAALPDLVFIEIKTCNQPRVREGFHGFFFALTEAEIEAAEALGVRHRVALFNNLSGELLLTSVPEILARSKSTNWQLSVQL